MAETILGACGLACSECEAFKATRAYDTREIERIAVEWSQRYKTDFTPEKVWCTGCMTAGERKCRHCAEGCEIRRCVIERKLSTCADCNDYACPTLEGFFAFFPGESPARVMLEALRRVRALTAPHQESGKE